jgi:hypothetical protein
MIFCFSECVQTVDMNQENRLAEAFKMRNLLQEFTTRVDREVALGSPLVLDYRKSLARYARSQPVVALVGFREWIFSGKVRGMPRGIRPLRVSL